MPAQIPVELLNACPRIAAVARVISVVLAVLGALSAVVTSSVGKSWTESLLQVSWVLVSASILAFVVMLVALWIGGQET